MRSLSILLAIWSLLPIGASAQEEWKMIWSDEFDGPANTAPDPTKWAYDVGATGWGNNELENYTTDPANAHLDGNGNLVIHVLNPSPDVYTSARLKTAGHFTVQYGKIEARIRLPYGQAIWPAFWMLGSNIDTVGWPQCGEVDIMENIGREPSINHGSMHGPGYSGGNSLTASYTLPDGARFSDDFHTFTAIWTPESVKFFVDSRLYETRTTADVPSGSQWVFNTPFFLILNVAVGGSWPGNPDASTVFPQDMTVDYVRVYQLAPAHWKPKR